MLRKLNSGRNNSYRQDRAAEAASSWRDWFDPSEYDVPEDAYSGEGWEPMTKTEWAQEGASSSPDRTYEDFLWLLTSGEEWFDGEFIGQATDGTEQPVFRLRDHSIIQAQHYQYDDKSQDPGDIEDIGGYWQVEKTLYELDEDLIYDMAYEKALEDDYADEEEESSWWNR